ncbi:299_t:CDS:2, partial [Diversispora eburnea]
SFILLHNHHRNNDDYSNSNDDDDESFHSVNINEYDVNSIHSSNSSIGDYRTKFNTTTKHIGCIWHINLSELSLNNPSKHIYITTLHNIYSYYLNSNIIQFGDNKQLSFEIIKEIEFLTIKYQMATTIQYKYFEVKFSGQTIYNNNLYKAIQNFQLQNKNHSNDVAKLYTKLFELSLDNPI